MQRVPATADVAERLSILKAEVGATCAAFARGISKWERGEGYPPTPHHDDTTSDAAMLWIGFMLARALDYGARLKLAEVLEGDTEAVEPDPPTGTHPHRG